MIPNNIESNEEIRTATLPEMISHQSLTFSKTDKCPNCFRLLSKRTVLNGEQLVHMRHRGYEAYAKQAVVNCMGCEKYYVVDSEQGILNEVEVNG